MVPPHLEPEDPKAEVGNSSEEHRREDPAEGRGERMGLGKQHRKGRKISQQRGRPQAVSQAECPQYSTCFREQQRVKIFHWVHCTETLGNSFHVTVGTTTEIAITLQ